MEPLYPWVTTPGITSYLRGKCFQYVSELYLCFSNIVLLEIPPFSPERFPRFPYVERP